MPVQGYAYELFKTRRGFRDAQSDRGPEGLLSVVFRRRLKEVFDDISPIADYSGSLSLEFVDFELCRDDVKYSIEECKERDATFAAPLKVKVRLYNKEKEEISEHEIFMGDLPLMTETGTFVINGAERVIVSSWFVLPVSTTESDMIRSVRSSSPVP